MMDRNALEQRWHSICRDYPLLKAEIDALLISEQELELLQIVYAGLDCHELPSVSPERIMEYVRASMDALDRIDYARNVSEDLFYDYVLTPRVNNEFLDGSRRWLLEQLQQRVQGKSMLNAALEVNYWCSERATYQSTDDRTIAPFGMCCRARGRCGEESTLLTCALRAVGIPARQVYVPLWAHCDDNHAWVEFWAEGCWHHMGACEPEPVPDVGWFDSAASRAMMARSRVPDFASESGFKVVNTLNRYAQTVMLRVSVQNDGKPMANAEVHFQIINECRLVSIHSDKTNKQGFVEFETGLGSLIVSTWLDGRLVEKLVDLRKECFVILRWEDGFDPQAEERTDFWELVPPAEAIPSFNEENIAHQQRLRRCEQLRADFEASFSTENRWLQLARGNHVEIRKFLDLDLYKQEDKEMLLSTLTEKDFADVTSDILEDYLAAAIIYKEKYPVEQWKTEILAPRVEHEMLQPVRRYLQSYFEGVVLRSRQDVLEWMKRNIRPIQEFGLTDRRGNAAGYVRHGVCPESEWEILAVQICRALGIPAALGTEPQNTVKLVIESNEPLRNRENWSLARWASGSYHDVIVPDRGELLLEPGSYRLITARRQIDGTVSARVKRIVLAGDRKLSVTVPGDRTAEMLKSAVMPPAVKQWLDNSPCVLVFLQPGAEPTEHLMQELLELKKEFNRGGWKLRFLIRNNDQLQNETFQRVLQEIPNSAVARFKKELQYEVQTVMGIGDARLPLVVVVNRDGQGVYGCANYNIRTGHRILQILNMIS